MEMRHGDSRHAIITEQISSKYLLHCSAFSPDIQQKQRTQAYRMQFQISIGIVICSGTCCDQNLHYTDPVSKNIIKHNTAVYLQLDTFLKQIDRYQKTAT